MAVKKWKNPKHIEQEKKHFSDVEKKKVNVSDVFLDELQWAFANFDKLSVSKRVELFGQDEYLEQFWAYFKKEHPNLLDTIDKKDLPIYIQYLEDKWFVLQNILKKPETLQKEFWPKTSEMHVIQSWLQSLHDFCDDSTNTISSDLFAKFASFAWFDSRTHVLSADGKIQRIDDLYLLRKKFLDKEGVDLSDVADQQISAFLVPDFNPTERVMVEVALKKIRKLLPWSLKVPFDERFELPITIFSPHQDVLTFKDDWLLFLDQHKDQIDEKLAKNLDKVIVTNGDIRDVLESTGKKLDGTKWFSERERYYRQIFNKLATRQLFEEVQDTQETIDYYLDSMASTFKEFPPYVNEICKIYPFNDKQVSLVDSAFHADIQHIDEELINVQNAYAQAKDDERNQLRKKIRQLKEAREHRRWQAYIAFLKTKNVWLAEVFQQLVANNFDFSQLSVNQQQLLVDVLVKEKLKDTIKHKVPELLSVTEEELSQFVADLFDLQKMDITIPTRHGPIPLVFRKKEFMASVMAELPGIDDLEQLKNLPLNFVTTVTGANEKFFEESVIFDSLYYDFAAKNGSFRINDAYKVKITKDGKSVEGYLSAYPPSLDEKDDVSIHHNGQELYLYSEPVTAPSQQRTLVTWEWPVGGTPVVIEHDQQQSCDVELLDKQLNLNGQALGALLFGYVLGQESMHTSMSVEKEAELAKKLWELGTYKEKKQWEKKEIEDDSSSSVADEDKEKTPYEDFLREWNTLKWSAFAWEKDWENGFVKWTRLFVPFADSQVYPKYQWKAWMTMEIVDINRSAWTFTLKVRWGELSLWSSEWKTKTLPLHWSSLKDIVESFGDCYKMPASQWSSLHETLWLLESAWLTKDLNAHFGSIKSDGSKFSFTQGDFSGQEVTHFGRYESGVGEEYDVEKQERYSLYKIKHNSNGTISLSWEFIDGDVIKKYSRDMDYPTFMLFVKEKWLQPKTKEQAKLLTQKQNLKDQETATTKRWFSINNVVSFFTNGFSKLKDAIKKYDEERAEDLTDILTSQWTLYAKIGSFIPSARWAASFEGVSVDYFAERDSRIRKKVEKRKKVFEDADFWLIYNAHIGPMLKGEKKIVPHYKAAAMLLAMINKGKWPYNRNPEFAAQGMRVNILMWSEHQKRYLAMREKMIKELHQWASIYGGPWTDAKKNEILELEMKYIVHGMDARHLGIQDQDKTKLYFYGKYSKQFIDELEWGYTKFFDQSTVEEWVGKLKWASFDFARAEYFRLLSDRPQQAVPFLKVMAMKAMNGSQWKVFEMAVMAGMLSGVFLAMTRSETQGMIKNICRTRWFVPGIWVKDINQQYKLQRMLDIFSGGKFSKELSYTPSKFSFGDFSWGTKKMIGAFEAWAKKGNTLDALSSFFDLTWKDASGKNTLLDIHSDPKTSPEDKKIIEEFIANTNEKNESLDTDVRNNPYAISWSILTKSQSAVHQMMKFDQNGFAGKDGDEIQTMEWFFVDMKKAIDSRTHTSSHKVKFFLDKFFNRFEEKGFSLNNKTELVKRLKRCQQNAWRPEVDDVMYYTIVGQISNSFGRVSIPQQFLDALAGWKDFFKNNLDLILSPDILSSSFGSASYKHDYDRYSPKLEPRKDCVNLLDRELKQAHMFQLAPEQRKLVNQNLTKLRSNKNYLNADLYDLADRLSRDCGIDNRFRKNMWVSPSVSDYSKNNNPSQKNTWAKINNPEVIDKVKRILEGKPLEDPEDDFVMEEEYEYMD